MSTRANTIALVSLLVVGGCSISVSGTAVPGQTSTSAAPLPFTPTIGERTNDRTDGTSFEPCTAYTDEELERVGISPRTVRDAGFSDSPNFRGCRWDTPDGSGWFGQTVANQAPLNAYKARQSQRPWQPDNQVGGRTLAVAAEQPDGCIAVFVSEAAVVISGFNTISPRTPSPGLVAECDTAIAWATLAIAKAP